MSGIVKGELESDRGGITDDSMHSPPNSADLRETTIDCLLHSGSSDESKSKKRNRPISSAQLSRKVAKVAPGSSAGETSSRNSPTVSNLLAAVSKEDTLRKAAKLENVMTKMGDVKRRYETTTATLEKLQKDLPKMLNDLRRDKEEVSKLREETKKDIRAILEQHSKYLDSV